MLVVFAAVLAGMLAWNGLQAGRQSLIWGLVAIVFAVLVEGPVRLLARHMPRFVAVLVALVSVVAFVGLIGWGLVHDIGVQLDTLKHELPRAANMLEQSTSAWGSAARQLELSQRATDFLNSLGGSPAQVAQQAAGQASRYFLIVILTIFFLIYGPRMWGGFLTQLTDSRRRARVDEVARDCLHRARRYLLVAIVEALVAGSVVALTAWLLGLAAPTALGLSVALLSVVPYVGLFLGAGPLLLLAGVHDGWHLALVIVLAATLQVAHLMTQRRIIEHAIYVGPAAVMIAAVLGYTVYGAGGALFGFVLAVIACALAEAFGTDDVIGAEGADTDQVIAQAR